MCPGEHMFPALWTLSTIILQALIHDLSIEWKKVLSSFVSQKERKKGSHKYYSLFHITGEMLECPVVGSSALLIHSTACHLQLTVFEGNC
jgi:hypothetical protein